VSAETAVSPEATVSPETAVSVLAVVGELTIQTAAEQKAALLALLDSADEVEVLLADVTELDTAGLHVLLLAKREAAQLGKTLRLVAANRIVMDVLNIAHLSTDLDAATATRHPEEIDR
jgi:anti-sigma B factor antagonist